MYLYPVDQVSDPEMVTLVPCTNARAYYFYYYVYRSDVHIVILNYLLMTMHCYDDDEYGDDLVTVVWS